MPTDICPTTGALRGGRGASLTKRRARRLVHESRARRARHRQIAASRRSRSFGSADPLLTRRVALDPPHFAGYVREFVPAVRNSHSLHPDLAFLLGAGLQSTAYDHIRAFTNPSVPLRHRRRKRKGHVPSQRLRMLGEADWAKLAPRHRALFGVEVRDRWNGWVYAEHRRYRFLHPDLYRLQVRPLWLTHRAVPTDEARERESFSDRYWYKTPYYEDLRYLGGGRWRGDRVYNEQKALRVKRHARADMEADLADLPLHMLRNVRIRP